MIFFVRKPNRPWALALLGLAWTATILPALAAAATTIGSLSITTVPAAPSLDPKADVSTWSHVPAVTLPWDVQNEKPASESSTARIATDGQSIYVRFDVKQRETLLANQHANDIGDGTDDEVWVDLWPNGANGFYYQFAVTSNGTHYQYSSENTAYAPTWKSYGSAGAGGFTATMQIPLDVLRGTSGGGWRVQFVRIVRSTGERQIWSYAPAQTNGDDVNFAGSMQGLSKLSARRPKPRIGVYALGVAGSGASGLTTSRVGADLSIPLTSTASFFATLHPDFSNVEVDQATISPTAFARFYNEVRPFFTQGRNSFENFDCDACPQIAQLYTPSIPTPRDGYAVEGKQGPISFGAFDSVGTSRNDAAQALTYQTPDGHWRASTERISADCNIPNSASCPFGLPSIHDDVSASGLSYNDGKHVDAYFDYGSDSGSNVAIPNQAQRYDGGFYVYNNTAGFSMSSRKIGYYYDPADGFVQHTDIAGYALYGAKIWQFSDKSVMNSIGVSEFLDRYHNAAGPYNQTDNNLLFDALTRNRIDVQLSLGSAYLLANNCTDAQGNVINVNPANYQRYAYCQVFTPISQNGLGVTWHSGTVNSPGNFPNHGSSSTPTSLTFNTGRFGPGRVDSWTRSSTIRVGDRGTFSAEVDDARQYLGAGGTNVEWLERFGYTYTPNPTASFAFGVRRILGTPPLINAAAPVTCTTVVANVVAGAPGRCTGAWNLSFAYHRRIAHDELYAAYGDASQLSTLPAFTLKFIHYFGAEKGT
ncbi:MAG: DUF5916 domain-containing protein [Candidatus Baltobacteraceae bacterium]